MQISPAALFIIDKNRKKNGNNPNVHQLVNG